MGEASQNPIDRHTHELYTKPRARTNVHAGPRCNTQSSAQKPQHRGCPPARSSHPHLLPLTTNASGPGQAALFTGRPSGPGRPDSASTGVRPGPLAACPSAGPRGQASPLSPPLRAGALSLRRPRSSLPARVPAPGLPARLPTREARAPGGWRAGPRARPPRAPTRLPAAGARGCLLRRSPGGPGAGPAAAAPLSPAPAPFAARPGAAAEAHVPARAAQSLTARPRPPGAPGRRDREGAGAGDRRAPRIELRPRQARAPGELARGGTGKRVTDWGHGVGRSAILLALPSGHIFFVALGLRELKL